MTGPQKRAFQRIVACRGTVQMGKRIRRTGRVYQIASGCHRFLAFRLGFSTAATPLRHAARLCHGHMAAVQPTRSLSLAWPKCHWEFSMKATHANTCANMKPGRCCRHWACAIVCLHTKRRTCGRASFQDRAFKRMHCDFSFVG